MSLTIALIGNPNAGKTSIFNALTGLSQAVGNYAGVTVDLKEGSTQIQGEQATVIDLPGTYSLHPLTRDERTVLNFVLDPSRRRSVDLFVYVADATQLDRHLLLLSQLVDLGLPLILILNLSDLVHLGDSDLSQIADLVAVPTYRFSARKDDIQKLKTIITGEIKENSARPAVVKNPHVDLSDELNHIIEENTGEYNKQYSHLILSNLDKIDFISEKDRNQINALKEEVHYQDTNAQVHEVMSRYSKLDPVIKPIMDRHAGDRHLKTDRIDRVISHKIWGPFIFFILMVAIFNVLFNVAEGPMNWIDALTSQTQVWVKGHVGGWLGDFLSDGIIAGLGGVIIFIPQIALLFLIIGLLEDIGYMSRAVYLFDGILRRFGLNGRSLVGMISGGACAIPAVMSTRTIKNWKERLITILIIPFISCSARLPVYIILIALAIPHKPIFGFLNTQGLTLTALYFVSTAFALFAAWTLSKILRSTAPSYLTLEMPDYRAPNIRSVFLSAGLKVKDFVLEAGKIIFIVSIVIWGLSNSGPSRARTQSTDAQESTSLSFHSMDIEDSYLGLLGKQIEPVIEPLGYDWKIGIALLTSFAAREVFVGTLSTIYDSEDEEGRLLERLRSAKKPNGTLVFSYATCLSLMVFYMLALQCMSTVAIVKRETNSWKWALLQFAGMTIAAYLASMFVYQVLT